MYGFAPMLSLIFSTCVLLIGHVKKFAKTPKSSKLDMNVWLRTLIYGFKVDMVVLVSTHAQMETLMFNAHGFSPIDDHQPPHVTWPMVSTTPTTNLWIYVVFTLKIYIIEGKSAPILLS